MKTNIFSALKVSALAIVISFGLSYAFAWTAPTATPPTGNVFAPINTGADLQTKTGNLSVANLGANTITLTGTATVNDVYITSIGKYASELFPVNLVNGQHTVAQCSSLGGATVDIGAGNKVCKLAGASCPVGWVKYNNWSTTQNQSLAYNNETDAGKTVPSTQLGWCSAGNNCALSSATCSSGSHAWGNLPIEQNSCIGNEYIARSWYTGDNHCTTSTVSCGGATSVTAIATVTENGCY